MKRFTLFASLCLAAGGSLVAQNVSVKAKNRPAATVFAEIMRQTDKNFIYSSSLLKGVKVSITAKNEPLPTVLDRMFDGTGITYRIRGNNIMLQGRPATKQTRKSSGRHVTISGYVRETGSQECIIGASVRDVAGHDAATTNNAGFYSLTLPVGKTSLSVSAPGYETFTTESFDAGRNITYNFSLATIKDLEEVTITASKNNSLAMDAAEAGRYNLSQKAILNTPVIFGESDVIKSLQLQPGISAGTEGMAGMYVHGGNSDENMYMLDNIPLYQVNHFAGLFSAFNVEALKNVDFYKNSFPAKYDGRLSSYVDVHTKDGSLEEHHGSARLGLTSGAFNIDGPIRRGTTSYSVALRRSWYDVLTAPAIAIINACSDKEDDKLDFRYAFTDFNAKVSHRFSDRSSASLMFYYGEDFLKGGSTWHIPERFKDKDIQKARWGNILAKAGWNYQFSPTFFGEFSAAYSHYASHMESVIDNREYTGSELTKRYYSKTTNDNNINDWTLRADLNWRPSAEHQAILGGAATIHSFLPFRTSRSMQNDDVAADASNFTPSYHAVEADVYIGDDWRMTDRLRVNAGIHLSLFSIDSKTFYGISPRASVRYRVAPGWVAKGGYSRTTQYVHQLCDSYLSLPTDQWVPVTKDFKPQTADKVFAGAYYSPAPSWTISVEGFYKWMHNLIDYKDEYYLMPPYATWSDKLVSGSGTAKGLDFKIEREAGRFTGHVAYSLLWADRTFAEKNHGLRFPAKYDNRHKINIMANWKINSRWEINAAWTGMSGNLITLPVNSWETPMLPGSTWDGGDEVPLPETLNNYRLPFYHRLDLSATRHTKHGYWTFSLYNAYCNMNVIAVRRDYKYVYSPYDASHVKPVFQKIHLLPIIPSVSYTWLF